ncbi:hypothetical protein [Paenibacillus donghaensis]|uniref:Uncharacterized protein n=1 Tax=Paenibacillus donghaensis TaxID=414771 RepID=A0A2Z2KN36_9BACL|nr:hypothetical protein [Paenibacillus donghaensis]ASA22582.1 hypothetical protein B9T62_18420 [Paenibacillus donghaensis]
MNYGTREVIELLVFDENGNKVAHLDSLKQSYLKTSQGYSPYLYIKDALLNYDLLEFSHAEVKNNRSDYEKELNNEKDFKEISYNPKLVKKCKLIAKTLYRTDDTKEDKEVYFNIPNAKTNGAIDFTSCNEGEPSTFDSVFSIHSYNENGDIFKIRIEQ